MSILHVISLGHIAPRIPSGMRSALKPFQQGVTGMPMNSALATTTWRPAGAEVKTCEQTRGPA